MGRGFLGPVCCCYRAQVKELVDEPALTPVAASGGGPVAAVRAALGQMAPLVRMPLLPKAILVFSIQTGGLFGMNTLRLWMPQLFATMEEALVSGGGREAQAAASLCDIYFVAAVAGFAVFWARSPDLVLALLAVYLGFCGISSTAILGVVVDVFPTALRTTMVALCMMFGRMGSMAGNVVFPIILDLSCPAPFFMLPAAIFTCKPESMIEKHIKM
ncbi:uncharacterized protein GBIM_12739 [Gryllus bimaculatus]|nr:uncharacterized protein GBIM_12739 [Gryllus bimaculatus]